MAAQRRYPEELRERAVKMVLEIWKRDGKGNGEIAASIGHRSWTAEMPATCRSLPRWHARLRDPGLSAPGMTQDDAPPVQDWRSVARWYAQRLRRG